MTVILTSKPFPECIKHVPAKASLIYCDPPYGGIVDEDWDKQTAEGYLNIAKTCQDLLIDGGSVMLWGGIGKHKERPFLEFLSRVERETDLKLYNLITWSKKRAYGKSDNYLFTREELAWLVLGDKPITFNIPLLEEERGYEGYNKKYPAKSKFKRRTNVWTDVTELFRGKRHPTEKPTKLAKIAIEAHTNPNDWVFDFFAGSGSTGVAANELNRNVFLAERDPEHFKTCVASFSSYTII